MGKIFAISIDKPIGAVGSKDIRINMNYEVEFTVESYSQVLGVTLLIKRAQTMQESETILNEVHFRKYFVGYKY